MGVKQLILLVPIQCVGLHHLLIDEILDDHIAESFPFLLSVLIFEMSRIIGNYLCLKISGLIITVDEETFREEFVGK